MNLPEGLQFPASLAVNIALMTKFRSMSCNQK